VHWLPGATRYRTDCQQERKRQVSHAFQLAHRPQHGSRVDKAAGIRQQTHMGISASSQLVLASASPRRRELLAASGYCFEVVPSNTDEIPLPGESPAVFAQRVAREKAYDVAGRHPDSCVLAADTVVVVNGALFGKPADRNDARRMLQALSGRVHRVLTAVALIPSGAALEAVLVESTVEFRQLTAAEIEVYLDSEEPYDKAGAYAVQGEAGKFVASVRGSYSNVIGLPIEAVTELLRRHLPAAANTTAPIP
jgi:septum formation protein